MLERCSTPRIRRSWCWTATLGSGSRMRPGSGRVGSTAPPTRQDTDYLTVWDLAALVEPALVGIADGIRSVLVGTVREFKQTFPGPGSADERWIELTARPLPVEGGIGVVVMQEDVTDRKGREDDQVARSLLVDEVDAAVIATDMAGVITSWSKGAERLYGWLAPDAIGRLCDALVGIPRHGDGSRFAAQVAGRDAWEGDVTAVRRDGSSVEVHVRAIVLRDARGLPSGMVVIAVARTERLAMDDQLRAITDSIGDGLCTLDGSGRVLYVNPQGRRMMRASSTATVGGSFRHWIHGLGDARPWEAADSGTGSQPVQCQLVRRDGTELPIEFVATALRTDSGLPVAAWVVVFRDVSATRSREDALAVELEEVAWLGRIRHALDQDGFVLYGQPIVDLTRGTRCTTSCCYGCGTRTIPTG